MRDSSMSSAPRGRGSLRAPMKSATGASARVTVHLDRDGDRVDLSIVDDGVGFQPAGMSEGMGLVTMRDRIGAVGGELEIISEPGAGVTVQVSIAEAPLRPSSEVRDSSQWRSV